MTIEFLGAIVNVLLNSSSVCPQCVIWHFAWHVILYMRVYAFYLQLVWNNTTHAGCGVTYCPRWRNPDGYFFFYNYGEG
ncbi:CAP domain-containing protein [Streptococcus dysgalactiae]|uniref:CAP domain-containing protein n=1 Tax=Streptococcus dysgalactiae TaxID=1334 RepID=UPI00194E1131|nr:hypothetical protein [Streptococcus dysgalactiae subsp. equisimilis]